MNTRGLRIRKTQTTAVLSTQTNPIAIFNMTLSIDQQLIGNLMGYQPMTEDEAEEPADTSLCNRTITVKDGWPHITWKRELIPVPTMGEVEEWVFDSVCFTPEEDEVEPDHPSSWLSILGMI